MKMFCERSDELQNSVNDYIKNNFKQGDTFEISKAEVYSKEIHMLYNVFEVFENNNCYVTGNTWDWGDGFEILPLQDQCKILDEIIFHAPQRAYLEKVNHEIND